MGRENFRRYIYGRQSGRCVGSRKKRKKIMRGEKNAGRGDEK
jgi:hypothetical protein